MTWALQFGIPSFDALFGRKDPVSPGDPRYDYGAYGIRLSEDHRTTSLCFIGPDGTGKSVFGLHLAAQYMADADLSRRHKDAGGRRQNWIPRALYVSTDLKYHVAEVMWKNFGLRKPNQRDFPFFPGFRQGSKYLDRQVNLDRLDPGDIQQAVLQPKAPPDPANVHFIDLVSKTMGDDWGFISRLLAVLKSPPNGCLPHLLVIDAVEGFETLVGETDAFGERTSRRARIAQIMRTAGEKCHVCFIIEEPKNDERFPEEFVTDVVVRLRSVSTNNYARRTVEILKARGQSHVRGQHPFTIRDGSGATTGLQENADEPNVRNSYVHVFPSLHYLSREEMKTRGPATPGQRATTVAAFGITYLDEMLARLPDNSTERLARHFDDQGLPAQTTTALIGEIATQKTSLATAFLARTFRVFTFRLADIIRELEGLVGSKSGTTDTLIRRALAIRLSFADTISGAAGDSQIEGRVDRLINALRRRNLTDLENLLQEIPFPTEPSVKQPDNRKKVNLNNNRGFVYFAAWLAEALDGNGAAVLVTTSDQDRDRLIAEFNGWLENSINKALRDWPNDVDDPRNARPLRTKYHAVFREALADHLRKRTICRRLELHDLSSPILFQIIQRSIERAQQLVFLSDDLPERRDRLPYQRSTRYNKSGNIRVVMDDLSTLKDTYTDIGSDPLFLPFLLSFLELEGVTSLIVDSQIGRPDMVVQDAFDRELRALVPHKLLTWRVPFYGEIRDAITVVPPYPSGLPSLIREVRWEDRGDGHPTLIVDPELELYTGLERSEPKPVPLEIRLYEETGPTSDYIRDENAIFGQLFTPLETQPREVIKGVAAGQYDALRDFCNLQTDTLLNHTMVFQVDEFWAANRQPVGDLSRSLRGPVSRREGALHPLGGYLTEFTSGYSVSRDLQTDRIADPFGLFQGLPSKPKLRSEVLRTTDVSQQDSADQAVGPCKRHQYFTRSAQGLWEELKPAEVARIDRIPYTWDFGFLLCPSSMWELAAKRDIGYQGKTVEDVWECMPKVNTKEMPMKYVNWRAFLGASMTVAHLQAERTSQPVRILDLSMNVGESLSCLLLEVWASEIMDSLNGQKKTDFFDHLRRIRWGSQGGESLKDWLRNDAYRLAFYKSWLLLLESLTLSDLIDREAIPQLKIRPPVSAAAATRHWYKTACGHQNCPVTNEPALPVRLPGRFSVRGDWFLAMAGGSRSGRLGRRALDLLSSRRANFRRLEIGIGLPTRDVVSPEIVDRVPTALVKSAKHGEKNRVIAVTYGELIGANIKGLPDEFGWFWRSQLRNYYSESRLWQKWIAQMIAKWEDIRMRRGTEWRSGFEIYDQLQQGRMSTGEADRFLTEDLKLESWPEFKEMCKVLERQIDIAGGSDSVAVGQPS